MSQASAKQTHELCTRIRDAKHHKRREHNSGSREATFGECARFKEPEALEWCTADIKEKYAKHHKRREHNLGSREATFGECARFKEPEALEWRTADIRKRMRSII